MSSSSRETPYFLDPTAVARAFSRVAPGYDDAAVLDRIVREQLLERLDLVAIAPDVILDLGTGTGAALSALAGRYPEACLIGADIASGMLAVAGRRAPAGAALLRADGHRLPLAQACVDLAFSNLMLPWCHDAETVFAELRRVLTHGGLLTFSTLGPDTLEELRRAFATVDAHSHVNYFFDMHDIGDALQRAGFADPVMDVEMLTFTYADFSALTDDLTRVAARNLLAGRPPGLVGRGRFERVRAAYERCRREDRLPATIEVIYGHAWAAGARPQRRLPDGGVAVSIADLAGRRGG